MYFDLTAYAVERGLRVAMTPSATPLVTRRALTELKRAGLCRFALSLDGCNAATHDGFRNVVGSYDRTFEILADARDGGLTLQINTTVTTRKVDQLDAIAGQIEEAGIVLWSVFFLVPVGRGLAEQRISAGQCEEVFETLWRNASRRSFGIKTTEAHHYRRFVLQKQGDPQRNPEGHLGDRLQRAPLGVNDGKGVCFISHTGQVFPSGFMPIECGKFPGQSVVDIYRDSPLMQQLRNPANVSRKCGQCEFHNVCGGSRARAFAVTGDPLASEPDCCYQSQTMSSSANVP